MLSAADTQNLQQALRHLQQGQTAAAQACLAQLPLAARPHPDVQYLSAIAAEQSARTDDALRHYAAATRAAPGNAGIWNSYGALLGRMGQGDAALGAWQKAVAAVPGHLESWINIAIAALDRADWPLATQALGTARALAPADPRVASVAGSVAQAQGDAAAAVAAFSAAIAARPGDLPSRHNRASALRVLGRANEALADLDAAIAAGLRAPETLLTRGHVLADLGRFDEAVAQYRALAAAQPDFEPVQTALTELLPQIGRKAEALDGYRAALQNPAPPERFLAGIAAARGVGDTDAMRAFIAAAHRQHGAEVRWELGLISADITSGAHDAALAGAQALAQRRPDLGAAQNVLAWTLLRSGDPAAAQAPALAATRLMGDSQSPWSLLTLIWRLLGDPREHWLIDYERLIMVADLPVPPGWATLPAFLGDLAAALAAKHNTFAAPADQTLRGGTQTRGTLFDSAEPVIRALRDAAMLAVRDCLSALAPEQMSKPGHPFLGRLSPDLRFSGSWSVRLKSQGFHVSHMHPQGWLSSAFYVALPPEVGATDAGALQFGVPEAALGLDLAPRRIVRPAPGRLVIFPSYAWHGTLPFESDAARLTAAFDVVPG